MGSRDGAQLLIEKLSSGFEFYTKTKRLKKYEVFARFLYGFRRLIILYTLQTVAIVFAVALHGKWFWIAVTCLAAGGLFGIGRNIYYKRLHSAIDGAISHAEIYTGVKIKRVTAVYFLKHKNLYPKWLA